MTQNKIEFQEFELDNGLHVILHKDNSNPIVSVDIWYHVGSKDEDPERTGFAHLFEHMMFQGSANVGKTEHFTYIQKAGGTLNGSTSQDRTNYFQTIPSNNLELVLWLESDRMSTLKVTSDNFNNQRDVVKEEKKQRYDNVPYGNRGYEIMSRAFPEHPYRWIPIGNIDHLNSSGLEHAITFYEKFYSPNNAVLVISGDIQYDDAKGLVKKYFNGLEKGPEIIRNYPRINLNQGEIRDTVYDNIHLPAVYIAYKIPGITSKDIYTLELLSSILSEGKSSRLYSEIVYKKKLARSVSSFVWDLESAGLLVVSANGFSGSDVKAIEKAVMEEIGKLRSAMPSERELEKAKNNLESDFTSRISTVMGKADMLAACWTFFRDSNLINTALGNYLRVTLEDISEAAQKYLTRDNSVILHYLPKDKKKSD